MFAWGTTTGPIQNVQTFVELPYTYTDWVSRFPSGSSPKFCAELKLSYCPLLTTH